MATIQRQTGSHYSNSLTNGYIPGDAATGHVIRYIDEFVDALDPYDTPFLTTIGIGKEIDNPKVEWGQRRQLPHQVTLNSNITDSAEGVVLASGQGAYLQQYMVLKIEDELVWIDEPPSTWTGADTPDVIRGVAGTTAAAHTAPITVEVVGIAEPVNVDHAETSYIFGDWDYNHFQRFGGYLQFDNIGRYTPNHEIKGDQLLEHIEEKAKDYKLLLEKAVIHGRRAAGTPDASGKRPMMMGGISQFLTTNVFDQSDANLSVAALESATSTVWQRVDTNLANTLYMNMNTKLILDRLIEPVRFTNMGPGDTTLDMRFTGVRLSTGTFKFVVSRYMPDGEIWGLTPSSIGLHPFKNSRWSIRDHETQGDHSKRSIHGVYTLIVKKERQMFRIYNFNTDVNDYAMGV